MLSWVLLSQGWAGRHKAAEVLQRPAGEAFQGDRPWRHQGRGPRVYTAYAVLQSLDAQHLQSQCAPAPQADASWKATCVHMHLDARG